MFHEDVLQDEKNIETINNSGCIKVCASSNKNLIDNIDVILKLPFSLKDINSTFENAIVKRTFNKNSSIKVKKYLLNKNEKKLSKTSKEIVLTEKEIQLIELFLHNKKPISKEKILLSVWNYSSEADTHTVETHIYRLRKKINDKFSDEKFIVNTKDGYSL